VSTAIETISLRGSSVPDANGAPLEVSAIINYSIDNPAQAQYAVEDSPAFIYNQGLEVMRRVCAQFPYRPKFGEDTPSLQSDSFTIGQCMRQMVQDRCKVAGVNIIKMELMEVAYSASIAKDLLQVQ